MKTRTSILGARGAGIATFSIATEYIGFYFIGYGSKRLITIEVVGLTIETQETVREILDPALEELGSFDLKAN